MTAFILRRSLTAVLVVLAMATIVFFGLHVIGDPAHLLVDPQATQEEIQATRVALGLDKPAWMQFAIFLHKAAQGDLGTSFLFGRPAMEVILERLPATLELAFVAFCISLVLGIPLGLYSGLKPDSLGARAIMTGSIFGFSLPSFWVGIVLVMIFSVNLGWLPATGRGQTGDVLGTQLSLVTADGWRHILLPAINLALFKTSLIIRLTRAGTREVVTQDYVKFARAKGVRGLRLVGLHIGKNVMVPIVTVMGIELGHLIAFSVVTESIFAWPGVGKLIIESILHLDRPVVVAYLMLIVLLFTGINLVVDILYSLLDPRIRIGAAAH
jgi:peptide/nickel transport system permease protein